VLTKQNKSKDNEMVYIFQTIDNFRDIADGIQRRSRICPSILFRSATLDYASEDDLNKLADELSVTTILDLRSELEAALSRNGKACNTFPVATALKLKPSDILRPNPEASTPKEKRTGPARKTIMINFAGKKFRKHAVWKAAPLRLKLTIVGLMAYGQKPKVVKLVGEEIIAKKGLAGLYRDFVDFCDQELCQALSVLSDVDNYPVLVHCTQGKDRTGLVTALALAAAGVSDEEIVKDYAKSREGLTRVRTMMVQEMQKDGLDSSFADAPPEVMRATLAYIRMNYGGIETYLDYIGFDGQKRKGLRHALAVKIGQIEAESAMADELQQQQQQQEQQQQVANMMTSSFPAPPSPAAAAAAATTENMDTPPTMLSINPM